MNSDHLQAVCDKRKRMDCKELLFFYVIILAVFKLLEQVCINFVMRKNHVYKIMEKTDKDFKTLYK